MSDRNRPLVHALAGGSSGLLGTALLQPLDVVKTVMIGTFRSNDSAPTSFRKSSDAIAHIVKTQGLSGLWRGVVPSLARVSLGAGSYFGIMSMIIVRNEQGTPTKESAIVAGAVGRTISATALNPLSMVKTRFEASASRSCHDSNGIVHDIVKIARTEGVHALFSGLIPTLIRDVPYSALNVLLFTQIKPIVDQHVVHSAVTVSLISGTLSAVLATALTHPFDVVRTRMQLRRNHTEKLVSVCMRIGREAGINGIFRGLSPRLLKRGISNAMTWTIYEQLVEFYTIRLID